MTKQTAIRKGWTIGRTMQGGYFARKNNCTEVADTLTALLKKLF